VRRAERCARFRAMAARDFLMFFFADAIFGKLISPRRVMPHSNRTKAIPEDAEVNSRARSDLPRPSWLR